MKNEKKLKLAKKRKEQHEQKLQEQLDKSEQEAKEKLDFYQRIEKAIGDLSDALNIQVEYPDIQPLLGKLDNLSELPDSFRDIKNMSIAISGKLEKLVEEKNKKQIITVRGFQEANKRFENIEGHVEKFADLQVYLEQLTETLKQGQDPEDFKPVRLVVGGDGSKLDFLKAMPSSRGGGGINTDGLAKEAKQQTDALTDDELRATPIPVSSDTLATEAKQNDLITNTSNTLFNSLDVSERVPIIELKSNYGISALRDITSVIESGEVTNDGTEFNLSTGGTTGSTATLSSAERGRYTPGAQGQAGIGVRLDETFTGTSDAKWGYFDDDNGFGFGVDATGKYVFTRRSGTDTKVYQSSWNGDKLNGSGASGLTLSLAEGNIFQIDFSWYGYGTIAFKVVMSDSNNVQSTVTVHRFSPSQQTSILDPNQPVSATITNGDTTNDLDLFVGGRQFSIFNKFDPNRRINSQYRLAQSSVGTSFVPAISFRRKSTFETVSVKIAGYDLITDGALIVQMRVDADLTNASFGTPTNTSASETACEVDTSATAVSGGELVYEALVGVSGQGTFTRGEGNASELYLDIPAIQPVTLCIRTVSSTATVSSLLRWREEW